MRRWLLIVWLGLAGCVGEITPPPFGIDASSSDAADGGVADVGDVDAGSADGG